MKAKKDKKKKGGLRTPEQVRKRQEKRAKKLKKRGGIWRIMGRRVRDVNNRRIGILVNGIKNAELLARETARLYAERHDCTQLGFYEKANSDLPCPPDELERLSAACDFLITGVGDSDISVETALMDGIAFEKLGKPALVICSKAYRETAQAKVTEIGLPEYPFIPVNDSLRESSLEEIQARALYVYQQGMAVLTGVYLIKG